MAHACLNGHKEIVELMIEKGANNFDWGLHKACEGGHKNLVLLMLELGADINASRVELTNSNIYYLVQKGITEFGIYEHYQRVAESFKESWKNLPLILDVIINTDLISEILTY